MDKKETKKRTISSKTKEKRMRILWKKYYKFMSELFKSFDERNPDFKGKHRIRDFESFYEWWRQLDLAVRRRLQSDYEKGYARVIAENIKAVRHITRRYLR